MKKEKRSAELPTVVLNALCALIWSAMAVTEAVFRLPGDSPLTPVLYASCAAVWTAAFAAALYRYLSEKRATVKRTTVERTTVERSEKGDADGKT